MGKWDRVHTGFWRMGGGVVAGSPGPGAPGVAASVLPVPGEGGYEVTLIGHHHGILLTMDPGPLPRPLKTDM